MKYPKQYDIRCKGCKKTYYITYRHGYKHKCPYCGKYYRYRLKWTYSVGKLRQVMKAQTKRIKELESYYHFCEEIFEDMGWKDPNYDGTLPSILKREHVQGS
jgi:hypothetical protein